MLVLSLTVQSAFAISGRLAFMANAALGATSSEGTPRVDLAKGPYRLMTDLASLPCLDVRWAQPANATPVQVYSCNTTNAQIWSLVPVDGPYGRGYQVVSAVSGSCLDVSGVSLDNSASVYEWVCLGSGHLNQIWQVYSFGDKVELVSVNSGKCLDIPAGNTANGTPMQQWTCGGGQNPNQLWTLSSLSGTSAGLNTVSSSPTGGGTATQHSVDLSWEAPPNSPDAVAGYRVYRSTPGGNFSLLNYALTTGTAYTDLTVASGTSYQYLVKSVDGSGVESVASNTFAVTVP